MVVVVLLGCVVVVRVEMVRLVVRVNRVEVCVVVTEVDSEEVIVVVVVVVVVVVGGMMTVTAVEAVDSVGVAPPVVSHSTYARLLF